MLSQRGKFENRAAPSRRHTLPLLPLCFILIEVFAFFFLSTAGISDVFTQHSLQQQGYTDEAIQSASLWPLAFGAVWAVLLTALLRLLPGRASRIGFGVVYFFFLIYAVVQTGYFLLFREMMWFSDFRYASEGSDYFDVLLSYPLSWWLSILGLIALGVLTLWKYPCSYVRKEKPFALLAGAAAVFLAVSLPNLVFAQDEDIQYAESDYGRSQSAEAAYENMFNAHRLYQVCGIYQTAVKDLYTHSIYPLTPGYRKEQETAREEIDAYFASREKGGDNAMTGLLRDKNVILVLMESMDDWMIGEHTPTLEKMMSEGINFTRFYTPGYGGIRTFNTEFCANTGSFLRSGGGYAFDYVTNTFDQSLASLLTQEGYRALTFHYNDPSFYSRGVFSPAFGYEEYVSYQDYVTETSKSLYDDQLLFDSQPLNDAFFTGEKKLNFVITRSAHLSYRYNEVLSYWGLQKYPEYKGLTGNEETDCALLKARLVDDFFARMVQEIESHGELENTVIIGITDHYTYGYKDTASLLELSGVTDSLLLERTPCFIWGADVPGMEVAKILNTSDLLPTLLNLLGVDSEYDYIGHDAFDDAYDGFVPFSDGSWITGDLAYNAGTKALMTLDGGKGTAPKEFQSEMASRVQTFTRINNLILDTDYYKQQEE